MSNGSLMRLQHQALERTDVLRVLGEVDRTTAPELADALSTTKSPVVVLDLTEVTFLDSAGVRAIENSCREVRDALRAFVVVAPADSRAGWTLRVAGFDADLVRESLESALET